MVAIAGLNGITFHGSLPGLSQWYDDTPMARPEWDEDLGDPADFTPETAGKYWHNRFQGLESARGSNLNQRYLTVMKSWANDPRTFGSDQGQVRCNPEMGRHDFYYLLSDYLFGKYKWDRELGELCGFEEWEFPKSLQ